MQNKFAAAKQELVPRSIGQNRKHKHLPKIIKKWI